jgi:siroheme decarboxylase
MLPALHKQLLNNYQQDFPLSLTPYQDIANQLGVAESEVLEAFQALAAQKLISRIGPVITPNRVGNSALVAMSVPEAELMRVAEQISRYREVNHNYERENRFNLWFVLIANDALHLQSIVDDIEASTGFKTMLLPMLADFYINLGFDLNLHD